MSPFEYFTWNIQNNHNHYPKAQSYQTQDKKYNRECLNKPPAEIRENKNGLSETVVFLLTDDINCHTS